MNHADPICRVANYCRTSDNVQPNLQMSEQNQILIGHNVRPNKIHVYGLMKKFFFTMLKEKLLFSAKKVRFLFVIQSTIIGSSMFEF